MIILDTHIWVKWILLGEEGMTPAILQAMASHSCIAVSSISCFEVCLLVKRGKIELPLPTDEWLTEALTNSGIEVIPVDCAIARKSIILSDIHKDPADRLIIATAIICNAKIASYDAIFPSYPELDGHLVV